VHRSQVVGAGSEWWAVESNGARRVVGNGGELWVVESSGERWRRVVGGGGKW